MRGRAISGALVVTLLCSIASIAGGEYVEKIAQIRLHNDTTTGYVLSAISTPWCEGACENDLVGLSVMEVNQIERQIPFAPRTAAFLSLPFPPNLHDEQEPADPQVVAAFWDDVRSLSTMLHDCGAAAVMIYHGQELCHESGQLFGQDRPGSTCPENSPGCGSVHLLGHCKTSMEEVRKHPVIVECRLQTNNHTYPPTVELPLRSASAVANAVGNAAFIQATASGPWMNLTVDFHVTLSACGNYGQFPAMYLSLVPLWTGLAFVWIALSCQVHSSFATTIHSVMTVVPVLKVLDVVISAWLWTDCVASGKFSTPAVLAWVAIRSLYEPFFMLVFLLIANGWCILRRDMPRSTSITISVVITSLYLVLALNFLYAGNFWWLVGTITVGTIVYSVIRVRGFVVYLTEKIESMDPQAFQEMYSQAVFKRGMLIRLQRIVQFYLVVQIVDYWFVQVEWQGEQAWKSQVFEQAVEIIVVTAMGFVFRPKQPGSGTGGRGRYFLEAGTDQGSASMRQVPFYEMSPVSADARSSTGMGTPGGAQGRGLDDSPGAVVVVNPNSGSVATSATPRYSVGQHVRAPAVQGRHRSAASAATVEMPSISFGTLGGASTAI